MPHPDPPPPPRSPCPTQHVVGKHSSPAVAVAAVRVLAQAGSAARSRDNDGDEPLHCLAFRASVEGLPALVAALVEAGGDVNARADDGASPLHSVARFASAAVAAAAVKALAAAGGQVSSKTTDGDQPLHWAVQHNSDSSAAAAAAAALIAAGADPHAPNGKGKLPVELALARPDAAQCAELLHALLGEAAGEAAGGSGGGEAAGSAGPSNAAGEAAGGAAGPRGSSSAGGAHQVLRLAAAAVSQLAKRKRPEEPVVPECPLCMERTVCMTGACGHIVCEDCAQQVRCGAAERNGAGISVRKPVVQARMRFGRLLVAGWCCARVCAAWGMALVPDHHCWPLVGVRRCGTSAPHAGDRSAQCSRCSCEARQPPG